MKLKYFRYTDASYQTYSQQCRQATNEAPFVTTPSPITEELARRGKYCSAGNSSFLPLRETVNICASQFSLSLSLLRSKNFLHRLHLAELLSGNEGNENPSWQRRYLVQLLPTKTPVSSPFLLPFWTPFDYVMEFEV